MGMYQASFRLRHECPYRELSEGHPDLTIREWYLRDCQVLEVTSSAAPTEDLLADLEEMGTVLHDTVTESGLHAVMRACGCSLEGSIVERFEAHDCLYQPPTVHRRGWEHYDVIAFDEGNVQSLYEDLDADRDIEVLSKTRLDEAEVPHDALVPLDRLFEDLTDRQVAAFRHALDSGYYEQPREASVAELAAETDVARSTYEEHLRKAENKLLTNAGGFARLRLDDRTDEGLLAAASATPFGTVGTD